MSNARDGFDAIAVVVDWIDAFRRDRLGALLDLYADDATIECCAEVFVAAPKWKVSGVRCSPERQQGRSGLMPCLRNRMGCRSITGGMTGGRFGRCSGSMTPERRSVSQPARRSGKCVDRVDSKRVFAR